MELRSELKAILRLAAGDSLDGAQAVYHTRTGRVELTYLSKRHRRPADVVPLSRRFNDSGSPVRVRIRQEEHADGLFSDPKLFSDCVRDFCVVAEPFSLPFVRAWNARVTGNRIRIGLGGPDDVLMFRKLELPSKLSRYLRDVYGREFEVEVLAEGAAEEAYAPPSVREVEPPPEPEEPAPRSARAGETSSPAPRPPKAVEAPPRPHGSGKAARPPAAAKNAPVARIADLQVDSDVTIDARIVSAVSEEKRDGELTVHKFIFCDNTGTIPGSYVSSARRPKNIDMPKEGCWARVSGKFEYDRYERENALRISSVAPTAHKDRMDMAAEKRVELHAHTKMSAMDAVTDIGALISRAAKWGHKAVAITDHGVGQAFPIAASAARKAGIKIIYGVEGYMFDDEAPIFRGTRGEEIPSELVVFSLLTSGPLPMRADIVRINAIRITQSGVGETFGTWVRTDRDVTPSVLQEGGGAREDIDGAPGLADALASFSAFLGDLPLAPADGEAATDFLLSKGGPLGFGVPGGFVDIGRLCRVAFPDLTTYKLKAMAQALKTPVPPDGEECLLAARLVRRALARLRERGVLKTAEAQALATPEILFRGMKTNHIILLCRNKQGMCDLNRLISVSHIDYLAQKKPTIPKSLIARYRERLIVGSACESGDLYRAVAQDAPEEELVRRASFYDYLEIQPAGNNGFLVREGALESLDDVRELNRVVTRLGDKLGIPVAATCDVHFLEPEDECYRRLLQSSMGYEPGPQPPLFFRTTEEMEEEFSYLGPEKAHEIVCEVPGRVADAVEEFPLLPDQTMMPVIDDAAEKIEKMAYENARNMYGDPLPEIVSARLKRELDSIIRNGFSVLYYSAHLLVKKSNEDGYTVGSRGSVGSSLAATMTGITEVNPLPPHYSCPSCRYSDFDVDLEAYDCGPDLPDAVCPVCGTPMRKQGYNIPFEVFLGIDADKVPDIDLNFSGEYQSKAHAYTEVIFGKGNVYRAGTILSLKEKNTMGYVKGFMENTGAQLSGAEMGRLAKGIEDVKKSTGMHPGGMVIVPRGHEIYEFTAVQWPANKPEGDNFVTTHYGFNSMHDILVKLDILGHDGPTIMRRIQDITGMDPLDIPVGDPEVLALFSGLEPLHIKPDDLFGVEIGTLGIPEFGTNFVREMLKETKPSTVAEIVRISGLSHGTDVWLGNAQTLIREGTVKLSEAICARDDIMNYLSARGVEKRMAFHIMEDTRKGKVAKFGFKEEQEQALREADIPAWFVESCRKIKYMFPKGHAVAYSLLSLRIAYMKLHHMNAFYATFFDVHVGDFDARAADDGLPGIRRRYEALAAKGANANELEKKSMYILQLACEMYLRGGRFLPVDLMKSDPTRFVVEEDGIRIPFIAIAQLGEKVARSIACEREKKPFVSVEDLERRAKVSSSLTREMKEMGILNGLPQSNQLSLFDS